MNSKIVVGIWFDATEEYNGGVNYFYNLIYAVHLNSQEVEFIFFVGDDMSQEVINRFNPISNVITTPWLRRTGITSLIRRLFSKLRLPFIIEKCAINHNVDVMSHIWKSYRKSKRIKMVYWIPDFQYLHYPLFFGNDKICHDIDKVNHNIVNVADKVIVSSNDALKDLLSISPSAYSKTSVLHFVAAVSDTPIEPNFSSTVLHNKYKKNRRFFYVPNQFWKHKNHGLVLRAAKDLKDFGLEPFIVFSGKTSDFRSDECAVYGIFSDLITSLKLQSNVYVAGNITYPNVLWLMKNCDALINPSLFEGWSSVVEESKSLGVKLLLSDINVHREQVPSTGCFFNPNDVEGLANAMRKVLYQSKESVIDGRVRGESYKCLAQRNFSEEYVDILHGLFEDKI
jgi:glycosyltransferase involved in cell wall biosynthesis